MLSFYQMCDKVNGKPYENIPAPVPYKLKDYGKELTSNPVGNTEEGNWELKPLTDDDSKRYAADDVVNHYLQLHQGRNPSRLGPPMTTKQFKDFLGHDW